jgi:hypothetical protein
LASSLCDAINWPGTWERLPRDGQTSWLHRADKVSRELAAREHVIVALDELDESDAQSVQNHRA